MHRIKFAVLPLVIALTGCVGQNFTNFQTSHHDSIQTQDNIYGLAQVDVLDQDNFASAVVLLGENYIYDLTSNSALSLLQLYQQTDVSPCQSSNNLNLYAQDGKIKFNSNIDFCSPTQQTTLEIAGTLHDYAPKQQQKWAKNNQHKTFEFKFYSPQQHAKTNMNELILTNDAAIIPLKS